jgi:hypothetical protein
MIRHAQLARGHSVVGGSLPHPLSLRSTGLSRGERQTTNLLPAGEGEGEGVPRSLAAFGHN